MDIKTIDFNTDKEIRFKDDDVIFFRFVELFVGENENIDDLNASTLNIFNLSLPLHDVNEDFRITYGSLSPFDKSVLDIMQHGYAIPVNITGRYNVNFFMTRQYNMNFYVYWSNLDTFDMKSKIIEFKGLYNSEQVMLFFRPENIILVKDKNS